MIHGATDPCNNRTTLADALVRRYHRRRTRSSLSSLHKLADALARRYHRRRTRSSLSSLRLLSHGADRSLRTLAYIALDELRILDQVEELRGCDKRLTACMLNRLGDLQF